MFTREEARKILVIRNENNEKQAQALYDFEEERTNFVEATPLSLTSLSRKRQVRLWPKAAKHGAFSQTKEANGLQFSLLRQR